MADSPTLLFGLGAQKAGTTWLYDYLAGHDECSLSTIKELHYFDRIGRNNWKRWQSVWEGNLNQLEKNLASTDPDEDPSGRARREIRCEDLRAWLQVTPGDHAAYKDFLYRNSAGTRLIGDITPSYAMLSPKFFQEMMTLGDAPKFVYLLRDPFDRLWSGVRMTVIRTADGKTEADELKERANARLLHIIRGNEEKQAARSDYARAIQNMIDTIPQKQLYIGFFEDLVAGDAAKEITDFLGISYVEPQREKVVHPGVHIDVDPAVRSAAVEWLSGQYEFVDRLLSGRVPAKWHSTLAAR